MTPERLPASDSALAATEVATPAGGEAGARGGARLERGAMVGRYRIECFVGGGGMGWVYRARDTELERDVAIKVLRPGLAGAKGRERLLAEARAMAKLQHRAVVPVYDVGEHGDGVYVAMALLAGGTLHDWMHARPRPWREVVTRFIEAGRGLQAAHAVGLVHRDFKPRNVLLGGNGEVQVADFGIASASVADGGLDSDGSREASTIAGTPAYMAPEQASGKAVDARADQYSFCVSLWEGLHGQRPQEAETRTQAGVVPSLSDAPRTRRRVPGWLTAAVARGFSPAPERRWPTMQSLLDALERGLGRRRRLAVGGAVAATVAAVVASYVALHPPRRDDCRGAATSVQRAWGPVTRMVVQAALRTAAPSFADDTLGRVLPDLDAYAKDLGVTAIQTCNTTSESPVLRDLRAACIDERVSALRGVARTLAQPSFPTAVNAVETVDMLPVIEVCRATRALLDQPPILAEQRATIEDISRKIDDARDLYTRGAVDAYLDTARALARSAQDTGYAPLRVRALAVLHHALSQAEADPASVARDLAAAAAEAHDDRMLAMAWSLAVQDLADGDAAAAAALLPVLDAAVVRAGSDADLRAMRERAAGHIAALEHRFRDAAAAYNVAAELASTDVDRHADLANVMTALAFAGDHPAAVAAGERAQAQAVAAFGANHPKVAVATARLGVQRLAAGDVSGASAAIEAAGRSMTALDQDGPWRSEVHDAEASLAAERGDQAAVLRIRRLIVEEDRRARAGGRSPFVHRITLAIALSDSGRFAEAEPLFAAGLAGLEALLGRESKAYADSESAFGQQLAHADRCEEAVPRLRHASEVLAARPEAVVALQWLGKCNYVAGRREAAFAASERALAICQQRGCPPGAKLPILANYGSWLIDNGSATKARGIALMREASVGFDAMGNHAMAKAIADHLGL